MASVDGKLLLDPPAAKAPPALLPEEGAEEGALEAAVKARKEACAAASAEWRLVTVTGDYGQDKMKVYVDGQPVGEKSIYWPSEAYPAMSKSAGFLLFASSKVDYRLKHPARVRQLEFTRSTMAPEAVFEQARRAREDVTADTIEALLSDQRSRASLYVPQLPWRVAALKKNPRDTFRGPLWKHPITLALFGADGDREKMELVDEGAVYKDLLAIAELMVSYV